MKKRYFWVRVYTAVIIVFLFALFSGVFAVGAMGWRQSLAAEVKRVEAQMEVVAGRLADTISRYGGQYRWALDALYTGLGEQQAEQGAYIAVYYGDELAYSTLPEGSDTGAPGEMQNTTRAGSNGEYVLVSRPLGDDMDGYGLVFAVDISAFVASWRQTFLLCAVLCAVLGSGVALVLLIVLRRLSAPLGDLERAADGLARGELHKRVRVKTNDEIGRLGESFDRMAEAIQQSFGQLEAAAAQKQRMIDNLAHETRTPLTAVRGYAEYLQQAPMDEERLYEVAGRIREQAERMEQISARILQLSALTAETMVVAPCSVRELFSKTEKSIEPKAAKRGVMLEIQPVAETAVLQGDRVLLESLLLNLADNAVKACKAGGKVWLAYSDGMKGPCISVEDTGHGLTAEQIERLGEPFYRADAARARAEGGAGLGVSLCSHIARLHTAELVYTSTPGKGTRAEVYFGAQAE